MNAIALPDIESAKLPIVYERATQALSECTRIDECKEWANKAEALASYARQSKDDTLRKMAERIQARAIRRGGELIKQQEAKERHDRDNWIAKARASFQPSERKPCAICGRFQSIAQAHHVFPLAAQWRLGVIDPIHDHEWLCPNHHVVVHIFIGQALAKSVAASASCMNAIADMVENMDEFKKIINLHDRSNAYIGAYIGHLAKHDDVHGHEE